MNNLPQVICPLSSLISDFPKNILVPTPPKSNLELSLSHPLQGRIAIVTDAGWDAVDAAAFCARRDCRAGWRKACERSTACGRGMLQRTAKSCGPDAPTLASSLRSRVGPTGLRQDIFADDGGKEPGHRGARRKPLKPLRAGMPGDSGVLVYSCAFLLLKRTRARGCNGHPAFPTPSLGGRFHARPGRIAPRGREFAS
jgi:hypothetical protein